MNTKILIIDDEAKYAYILEKHFKEENFDVELAFDGMEGLNKFRDFKPDIVVLDIMLPKMNGYEVARRIREVSDTPIVLMSELSDESDILKGYDLDIDEYVTKPFSNAVLVAKVKTILLRRRELAERIRNSKDEVEAILIGDVKIVPSTMECFIKGDSIKLTKTEFELLEYLMKNVNKNCTRDNLMEAFWKDEKKDHRIIDTYVKKLRRIISLGGLTITTVFGIGYKLEEK